MLKCVQENHRLFQELSPEEESPMVSSYPARIFHSIGVITSMFHFLDSKSDKYGDTNTNKEIKIVSIPQPVQV